MRRKKITKSHWRRVPNDLRDVRSKNVTNAGSRMTSGMFGPKTLPTRGPERPFRCLDIMEYWRFEAKLYVFEVFHWKPVPLTNFSQRANDISVWCRLNCKIPSISPLSPKFWRPVWWIAALGKGKTKGWNNDIVASKSWPLYHGHAHHDLIYSPCQSENAWLCCIISFLYIFSYSR